MRDWPPFPDDAPLVNENEIALKLPMRTKFLALTKEEVIILANHLKNEYMTHEEPVRSLLVKIYQFADSK